MTEIIRAEDLYKSYGTLPILKGINLSIYEGEIVSIVGASGAGKTTLLQILGTLDLPDSGKLFFEGLETQSLNERAMAQLRNKSIGFVFQSHQLLPEFSALENVCMPAFIHGGKSHKEVLERAEQLLRLMGLHQRTTHLPSELSGGECQRVAMARALMNAPRVIFADEPSGSLDSLNKAELHDLFFALRREFNQTFVIVTHDVALAERADRMIVLNDGVIERIWTNPSPEH